MNLILIFYLKFNYKIIYQLIKIYQFFVELKNTLETQVNEWKSQIESKCVVQ